MNSFFRYTTHLFGEHFLRKDIIFAPSLLVLIIFLSFLFLIGICNLYSRLIISCSSSAELYPLSKHRCCILVIPSVLFSFYDRIINTSNTSLMSNLLHYNTQFVETRHLLPTKTHPQRFYLYHPTVFRFLFLKNCLYLHLQTFQFHPTIYKATLLNNM